LGDVYNDLDFPLTFEAWVYPHTKASGNFYGLFSSDASGTGNYYGLWIRINEDDHVELEIGSGAGAGTSHRRGLRTINTIPFETWTHVAIVATSATDMTFYFNGVEQSSVSTGGTAGTTSILHNGNHAFIGRNINVHQNDQTFGQMDEIRLWDTERTAEEIRSHMCSKLTGGEAGLLGYWIADESFTATEVLDMAGSADGTIVGSVDRILSAAPLGNESYYLFSDVWGGVSLSIGSSGGDLFEVTEVGSDVYGIFIYRVDGEPYADAGLLPHPAYYFGVFPLTTSTPEFGVRYNYSFDNGVVSALNESSSDWSVHDDGADESWVTEGPELDTTLNQLSNTGNGRQEYIFGVSSPKNAVSDMVIPLKGLWPNPASEKLHFNTVTGNGMVRIFNMSGEQMYVQSFQQAIDEVPVTGLASGQYVLLIDADGKTSGALFVKE
nr:T9SS type A sorting domain-containing protein [Chitinophagales bacterium]